MHGDTNDLLRRVLRLEQRLQQLQDFIEDGIADPWDQLEDTTLPAITERLAALEERLARQSHRMPARRARHTRARGRRKGYRPARAFMPPS